ADVIPAGDAVAPVEVTEEEPLAGSDDVIMPPDAIETPAPAAVEGSDKLGE
ncbi:MAG: hypothetical protein ACD_39C01244G0002, partial [uncultured bacterium]